MNGIPPSPNRFFRRLLWISLAAFILIFIWAWLPDHQPELLQTNAVSRTVTPRGDLAMDEKSTIELFEKSKNSVVYITTSQQVMDVWTRNVFNVPRGTGSGFIWDDKGHVVTNFHVLANASGARVRLNDGRELRAALVGVSPEHDIAVLRIGIAFNRPPPTPVGSSHDLKVGQKVFAIGNPFGLDWTLTTGIVSALDRSLPAENDRSNIEHLIQTDAAINPGNSGGPLLDSAGRLIGINTAIYSPSGASAGISFAVPVDTVNRIVPQLIAHGKYIRPDLGVVTDERINQAVTRELGVPGVVVLRVERGSAGELAGLRSARIGPDGSLIAGDIITAVEGHAVDNMARFLAKIDERQVGDTVTLTVSRKGQKVQLRATLQPGN